MNVQQRWERSFEILARYRELVAELERLPKLPIVAFLDAEMRRKYRRFAARLRAGKVEPRYKNLFTAEQLADLCEAACARDEFLEKAVKELRELAEELRAMLEENSAELASVTMAELLPAKDAAQWLGPDSMAEQKYREIQQLRRQGQRRRNHPPKSEPPQLIDLPGMDYELHVRQWLAAAELVPEQTDAERIALRIGVGDFSWVGTFQRGVTDYTTVQLMPDDRHLLIVTDGAGTIVEIISHVPVAEIGRDIASVISDESSPFLLFDHGGTSLEAFGPEGRMWQTGAIACGGFREFSVADGTLTFEACQGDGGWVEVTMTIPS